MYGDKTKPQFLTVIGYHGVTCPCKRFNIEHYITRSEYTDLRFEKRMNFKEIIRTIGYEGSDVSFRNNLRRLGWPISNGYEKYSMDESFFAKDTIESAWALGWLVTDGHVRRVGFSLEINDRDVLQKLKSALRFEGPVNKAADKKYALRVYRQSVVSDIVSRGVPLANKTFTCQMPKIQDEHVWHFLRGAFEGDGSIVRDGPGLRIYICGASEKFIYQIQDILNSHDIQTYITRKDSVLYLNSRNMPSALRWALFMYENTDASIRMDRKFNKFVDFVRTYYDRPRKSPEAAELIERIRHMIPECAEPLATPELIAA